MHIYIYAVQKLERVANVNVSLDRGLATLQVVPPHRIICGSDKCFQIDYLMLWAAE